MLQGKKFMKVLTAITVCTVFTAGFTTQAASRLPTAVTIDTIDKGEKDTFLSDLMGAVPAMETEETKQAAKEAKETYIENQRKAEEEKKKKEEAARLAAEEALRVEEEAKRAADEAAQAAARQAEQAQEASQAAAPNPAQAASAGEQQLLAAIIFCEAGNQPYEGQVAVGAVIMNRVRSGVYPNSISDVIYQSGQFGPAMTGWLDSVLASGGYTDTAMSAAADALAGVNPIGDCLYFGNGDYGIRIGDHFFH